MLLIFDCDGVLVDSETLSCKIEADYLSELSVPLSADDVARQFIGRSMKDMVAELRAAFGDRIPHDFAEQLTRRTLQRFQQELQPIMGVREAILGINAPRCVASSSAPPRLAVSLKKTGLADLFGVDVFSATMVARGKPAPDLFLFAAEKMGHPPGQCVVIEDSVSGVKAGIAAGMRVIGFYGGSHCQRGHDAVLKNAGAHIVIDDMRNLQRSL
ncbi:MAG: HAD family hydrolase [Beijerinckiaceae bacterium]